MDDLGISMREIRDHFGSTVPQVVFDFVGSNRIGLTVEQKRAVLNMMATVYYQGVGVGRSISGADEAERTLYEKLECLSQRIAKLEKNA